MSEQQKGFEFDPEKHSRTDDLSTSKAAAHSIVNADVIMGKILAELQERGPGTQSELAQRTGLEVSQVWKRLSDLKAKDFIEPSGSTRPGPSGRAQTVWQEKVKRYAVL